MTSASRCKEDQCFVVGLDVVFLQVYSYNNTKKSAMSLVGLGSV